MSIVVVGKSSFLAKGLREYAPSLDWTYLSHDEAINDDVILRNASAVINFAFSPHLMTEEYQEDQDIDAKLAKKISRDCHYVMISTRMVYGSLTGHAGFCEDAPLLPENAYGRNKALIETQLKKIISPDRLTILRLSNVFGYEPGRPTFFGVALTNLNLSKTITFDIAPDSMRDFLPLQNFTSYVRKIVSNPQAGIFNLGCGFGIECGKIASWIIEGYGAGEIVSASSSRKGEFFLNMDKTRKHYDLELLTEAEIRNACIDCGRRLKSLNL